MTYKQALESIKKVESLLIEKGLEKELFLSLMFNIKGYKYTGKICVDLSIKDKYDDDLLKKGFKLKRLLEGKVFNFRKDLGNLIIDIQKYNINFFRTWGVPIRAYVEQLEKFSTIINECSPFLFLKIYLGSEHNSIEILKEKDLKMSPYLVLGGWKISEDTFQKQFGETEFKIVLV